VGPADWPGGGAMILKFSHDDCDPMVPGGYSTVVNYLTRPYIPSIIKCIIISLFADIHSSNHTFDPTRVLPMPRK
jgi:hypothetical protein